MNPRRATVTRKTRETFVEAALHLDGTGEADVKTGVGFFDHMLEILARHADFDLSLRAEGDLQVDDHHTVEDCALVLGRALDEALESRRGVARFGWALAPLDEALARAVIDLSGRPSANIDLGLAGQRLGTLTAEMLPHFFTSLTVTGRFALHLDVIRGANDHHRAEAAFKAVALALRQAVSGTGNDEIRSTKGSL